MVNSYPTHKIYHILNNDSKEDFFDLLHTTYAETFDWCEISTDEMADQEVGEFIANVAMYTYKQYAAREKKGLHIQWKNLPKILKQFKAREKFKAFFARIFRKKKKETDD